MSFLCYAYIPEYRALKGAELRFDPRWKVTFDARQHTLTIRRQDPLPDCFWGPHIHSLTAIVGQNAAGKSSALRYILNTIVDGTNQNTPDCILIYSEPNTNSLTIYRGNSFKHINICTDKIPFREIRISLDILTLLYRGHFYPYNDLNEWEGELQGMKNISDSWLLIKDLQDFRNEDTLHQIHPLSNHLNAHFIQNNLRIARFLTVWKDFAFVARLHLPKYVLILPNSSGYQTIHSKNTLRSSLPEPHLIPKHISGSSAIQNMTAYITEAILANHIVDFPDPDVKDAILDFWGIWYASKPNIDEYLSSFLKFSDQYCSYRSLKNTSVDIALQNTYDVVNNIVKLCKFREIRSIPGTENAGVFYFELKEADKYLSFIENSINANYFVTSRFFDIAYSHSLTDPSELSSGEYQMLNLFSRIYDTECVASAKPSNYHFYPLIVLDEAETSYHPDWQRKYISMITDFLNEISQRDLVNNDGTRVGTDNVRFQVVYTTHSPTSLSDVPECCVNFLQRDPETGLSRTHTDHGETFGANVFDLYRDSFFMHDGLVGSFATEKIKNLVRDIEKLEITANTANAAPDPEQDKKIADIRKVIALIGDLRIREYLTRLLEEKLAPASREASLIEEIERLRRENEELQNRLNTRGND